MLPPVKDCAKLASRYLTLSLGSISLSLYSIVKFDLDLSLGLEQNKKYSVLPKCNDNFVINQPLTNDLKLCLK